MKDFRAARDAGRFDDADAASDRAAKAMQSFLDYPDVMDLLEYRILQRGMCTADQALVERLGKSSFLYLQEGMVVCEAMRLAPGDDEGRRKLLADLLDGRTAGFETYRPGLFDAYARQTVIDRRALQWLADNDLDERRFSQHEESALIAQIKAGRAENVRYLLQMGYDPNLGIARWRGWPTSERRAPGKDDFPVLPLQAARQSLATQGKVALGVARVLLEGGANPNKLHWYPDSASRAVADPVLAAELEAMLDEAGRKIDPIDTEFRGYLTEWTPKGESLYARFLVGNGSDKPIVLRAWKDGEDHLLGSLVTQSHLQSQQRGGTLWVDPMVLEDGISPSSRLKLAPGESHEILFQVSTWDLIRASAGMRYRLWFRSDAGEHHSTAFDLTDLRHSLQNTTRKKARSWDFSSW